MNDAARATITGTLWSVGDVAARWGVSVKVAARLLRVWSVPRVVLSEKVVRYRPGEVEAGELRAQRVGERMKGRI
jgi:hypothetical protein